MQVTAKLRYARISPQKCRLVADVVRGKPVGNALSTLQVHAEEGRGARAQGARVGGRERASTTTAPTSTISRSRASRWMPRRCSSASRPAPRAAARASSSATATSPSPSATARRTKRMGQKVNPLGIRLGITRDWTSQVVCRQEAVPAARAHRFPRARVPQEEACRGLGEPHPDRARRQEGQHHDPDRASGHRDRQEGRGHREAAPGDGEAARHADAATCA